MELAMRSRFGTTPISLLLAASGLVALGLIMVLIYGVVFPHSLPPYIGTQAYVDQNGSTVTPPKTLWDLLELLVIPFALAITALPFNHARQKVEQQIAEQRFQNEALQTYLDRMTRLLLEDELLESQTDSAVQIVARAQTLSTLRILDSKRRGIVVRFLSDARLIRKESSVVYLRQADLREADLEGARLYETDLGEVDMHRANLRETLLCTHLSVIFRPTS